MKFTRHPYAHPAIQTLLVAAMAALLLPHIARAECKEMKIVEYEDRVEAVCVGEPLTEAQKKANLEEEKLQEAEAQRQRVEEQKRQRGAAAAGKSQSEAELKKRNKPSVAPPAPVNRDLTNPQILYR